MIFGRWVPKYGWRAYCVSFRVISSIKKERAVMSVADAEQDVLDHRLVTIPAEDWDKFEDWVKAPAKEIPALRKLSATRPAWHD